MRAHAVNQKVLRSAKLGSFYFTASAYWSIVEGNKTIVRATAVNALAYVNYLSRWRGVVGWFIERFPVPSTLTMQIPCRSVICFRSLFGVDYTGRRDNHEVCVLSPQQSPQFCRTEGLHTPGCHVADGSATEVFTHIRAPSICFLF